MDVCSKTITAMIEYNEGDPLRIHHFLKVHSFARVIGQEEALDDRMQLILELAAITHDIGIRNSEIKYGNASGIHQQIEGPPEARMLLARFCLEKDALDRICWLIAHHHSYEDIQDIDHQIIVEADFLVNLFEDGSRGAAIRSVKEKIFKTPSGNRMLDFLFCKVEQNGTNPA